VYFGIRVIKCLEIVAATIFKISSYYIGYIYKSFLNANFKDSLREIINLQSHASDQQFLESDENYRLHLSAETQ